MRSFQVLLTIIFFVLPLTVPGVVADACTSFLIRASDGPVMAKNFDWDVADGMVVVNPRGLAKSSIVDEGMKPVRWTSRYGSVSFNQYGREFPMGGMNEAGLAMEVLWLAETVYPQPDGRASIDALQWVQYCLDSFRSVADVVASASELAVSSQAALHFLACEKNGTCAVIEFLDGKLVERSARTLPLPVLTNDTYSASLTYLNRTLGYGGEPVTPEGPDSLPRFARSAQGLHKARSKGGDNPVNDAFTILADVAQPGSTQWSIVYEPTEGRVHFTSSTHDPRRSIDLSTLDLDCTADPQVLNLASKIEGDVSTRLEPYTEEDNLEIIKAGFTAKSVAAPSDELIQTMAAYPDGLVCTFAETAK